MKLPLLKGKIDTASLRDPQYWVQSLIDPVRFASTVQVLHHSHEDAVILEIGPHSSMAGPLRQIHDDESRKPSYVATQKKNEDYHISMLAALGQLHQRGIDVDFRPLFQNAKSISSLPPYP
jgi:acyl transferase domain-containing protein